VPCLPIALNSGLFWPRRTFMRYPGTLVVEFLDPLPPGLPKDQFLTSVQTAIEDATGRLVEASRKEQERLIGSAPGYAPSEN
jgi:1-acyl-sn-glycerol-3-phosphate acyltransferase